MPQDKEPMSLERLLEELHIDVFNKEKENKQEKEQISDEEFWHSIRPESLTLFRRQCRFMLDEFGTSLACNRFDIGNCVEYAFADVLTHSGHDIISLPNAKRIDISIENYDSLSIKYSSSGNIRLHNSLGVNTDTEITKTVIITPKHIFLIDEALTREYLDISKYIKNTHDALELKRSVLSDLLKKKYPYIINNDICVKKEDCRNIQCSQIIWDYVKERVM